MYETQHKFKFQVNLKLLCKDEQWFKRVGASLNMWEEWVWAAVTPGSVSASEWWSEDVGICKDGGYGKECDGRGAELGRRSRNFELTAAGGTESRGCIWSTEAMWSQGRVRRRAAEFWTYWSWFRTLGDLPQQDAVAAVESWWKEGIDEGFSSRKGAVMDGGRFFEMEAGGFGDQGEVTTKNKCWLWYRIHSSLVKGNGIGADVKQDVTRIGRGGANIWWAEPRRSCWCE